MTWEKLGLLFCPDGSSEWMFSHASHGVPEHRGGDEFRVYFTCRDRQNRSHIAWLDLELAETPRVLRVAEHPVVSPGPVGTFDDSGCTLGCVVEHEGLSYLYYMGWNLGVTAPWRNSIGLAVRLGRKGVFQKYSLAPIIDRADADPYTLSYPSVLVEDGLWRMWYGSSLSWEADSDVNHVIKYAESNDGVHWRREGVVALGMSGSEHAVCRPWVVREGDRYRMWYCGRGGAYRIGYAESADGLTWRRKPAEVGIDVSAEGWDSEMLAYPCVFSHRGRRYLFYSGNRYGKTGLGLAVESNRATRAA